MKILSLAFLLSISIFSKDIYITIDTDAIFPVKKLLPKAKLIKQNSTIGVFKMNETFVNLLSTFMHKRFNRCGGFIYHESLESAEKTMLSHKRTDELSNLNLVEYSITKQAIVKPAVSIVREENIREHIIKMSSFRNRYYQSKHGVESQKWLKEKWEKITESRSDIKVEYFKHDSWKQPSIIATIEGTDKADEFVILGGHADSIAGFWSKERAHAPGADDNASGIATITEALRVAVETGYKPKRTIQFMAYAAEEVGLRGSGEIASAYKKQNKNVLGVAQFDMTNHKGTDDLDIVFMTDYTNKAQTEFMGKLIDEYVKVPWGYSKCGYGCSDHASWHRNGYPAAMPFESTMQDINGHIHTNKDTIARSNSDANHATHFAKLAVSFMMELGK